MLTTSLASRTSAELSQAYAEGLDPREVAEAVIERVQEREPVLNALYLFDPEQVRADAAASARRWAAGAPLSRWDGVPATVKENVWRKGRPAPSGTALPEPPLAPSNAPIVDRLEEAGVVIVGSTTMPDWGMLSSGVSSLHGISRNAWDPTLTTGGSSAGAGAAAAAGYGPWHVGTDIGGSIRLPGSWAGLATLKPSDGLVPLHAPYKGRVAGPMARSVAELQAMMSVIATPDPRDYLSRAYSPMNWAARLAEPSRLRVAVQREAGSGAPVEPDVAAAFERAVGLFAGAGARLEEIAPFMPAEALAGLDGFWRTRSWNDLQALPPEQQELVLPYIARWARGGAQYDGAATIRNFDRQAQIAQVTRAATDGFDLVLSPVAPMAAFPAERPMPIDDPDQPMAHISFTLPYNMSGQPAATVNCGFTADGRTIGLQIAGPIGADDAVLAAAAWFESVREQATPDWSLVP